MIENPWDRKSQRNRRLTALLVGMVAITLVISGQFFHLQVLCGDESAGGTGTPETLTPTPPPTLIAPERGNIWDASGHLLALNHPLYELSCDPSHFYTNEARHDFASKAHPFSEKSAQEIYQALQDAPEGARYLRLANFVPAAEARAIPGNSGIFTKAMSSRIYPHAKMAAHVLGFVRSDGEQFYGLEQYYAEELGGRPGRVQPKEGGPAEYGPSITAPRNGADLVLTINRAVQFEAERILSETVKTQNALGGSVIVMNPQTGAIWAMASVPSYDPNRYWDVPAPYELFDNPCISKQYEPGSVFKIVTMAAALDSGTVTKDTIYHDTGQFKVGGRTIRNHDRQAYGPRSMTELMVHSLNVGAAKLAVKMRAPLFYEYVARFGFGHKTGIDLANEMPGRVSVPGDTDWYESNLGANSFGQALAVTPLQMVTAVAAVANGGILVKPHIVQEIRQGGEVTEIEPTLVGRAISPETARTLTEMLVKTVDASYPEAKPYGYSVAGKTGTAQIPTATGYAEGQTDVIASFVGYVPAYEPRFIVLVKIDEPHGIWGSSVAVPAFRRIADRLTALLDVPPDQGRAIAGGAYGR
jgi:cell division protein FtsI/penicillin-binding protein 2